MKLLLIFCLSAVLCGLVNADLVLIGGGLADDNTVIYGKIVELAGGIGNARIGVITTASADPLGSATFYEDLFVNTYGAASATWIPVTETSGDADTQVIADMVAAQTGLFFGGGDQARVIAGWRKTDTTDTLGLAAIRTLLANGGVVAGTSAGAACMGSGPMIEGGVSYFALKYGAYPGGYNPNYPDDLAYNEDGGLGLLPGYIVDTHYSPRGREGRLIELVLDTMTTDRNTQVAIGIDENMAIHINAAGEGTILSSDGGVMYVDLGEASEIPGEFTVVNNVRVSFFTEDDSINLNTGEYTIASWKSNIAGNEYYDTADTSNNIFSSPDKPNGEENVFRDISHRLWDSKEDSCLNYSYERAPTIEVTLTKSDGVGYGAYSPTTGVFTVSYSRMVVDINHN